MGFLYVLDGIPSWVRPGLVGCSVISFRVFSALCLTCSLSLFGVRSNHFQCLSIRCVSSIDLIPGILCNFLFCFLFHSFFVDIVDWYHRHLSEEVVIKDELTLVCFISCHL